MSMSVRLFRPICLSARMTRKPYGRTSPFLCMLRVAVAQDGAAICYVLTVLRMTSCFHAMGPGAPTDFQKLDTLEGFSSIDPKMTKHKREAALTETTKNFCQKFLLVARASNASAWGRPCMGPTGRIKQDAMLGRSSPGGGTSWTSDDYNVWLSSSECGPGAKSAGHQ